MRSATPPFKDPEVIHPRRDDVQKQRIPHPTNLSQKDTPKRGAVNSHLQQNKADNGKGKWSPGYTKHQQWTVYCEKHASEDVMRRRDISAPNLLPPADRNIGLPNRSVSHCTYDLTIQIKESKLENPDLSSPQSPQSQKARAENEERKDRRISHSPESEWTSPAWAYSGAAIPSISQPDQINGVSN